MSEADTTIWDYVVTYGGPSLFMTAVFVVVLPLVWFKLARPRLRRWPSRLALMLAVWIAAWLIAYGDVLMIAREAKRVCEAEAGLRVYRTVEVEGFAGTNDIRKWSEYGFRFVENQDQSGDVRRYEMVEGHVVVTSGVELRSKYQYKPTTSVLPYGIVRRAEQVRGINTNELLGERVMFGLPAGWVDSQFVDKLGFRRTPVWCVSKTVVTSEASSFPYGEVVEKSLRARNPR